MTKHLRATVFSTGLLLLTLGLPHAAVAQGFASPYIGYNFGGDAGCPQITGCEDKNLNIGVGFGSWGTVFGAEFDIGYAKDFFGETPAYSSSVLTLMGNVLVGPRFGPVRPYGTAGLGIIKTNVDFTAGGLLATDNNHFGWDIGGGLVIHFNDRVGLRGDIRHFHAFQDASFLGVSFGDTKLDFGRASGGLIFTF
jgi:opacity protein-like surface antigen